MLQNGELTHWGYLNSGAIFAISIALSAGCPMFVAGVAFGFGESGFSVFRRVFEVLLMLFCSFFMIVCMGCPSFLLFEGPDVSTC